MFFFSQRLSRVTVPASRKKCPRQNRRICASVKPRQFWPKKCQFREKNARVNSQNCARAEEKVPVSNFGNSLEIFFPYRENYSKFRFHRSKTLVTSYSTHFFNPWTHPLVILCHSLIKKLPLHPNSRRRSLFFPLWFPLFFLILNKQGHHVVFLTNT